MFVRSKVVKGRTYYQAIETYRSFGKVRHRTLASLGTCPTVEDAYHEAVLRLRSVTELKGGKWVIGPRNQALYDRVVKLDRLRERPHGYKTRQELEAETERRRREAEERERAAPDFDWEQFAEAGRRLEERLRRLRAARDGQGISWAHATLGLTAPATADQVKAAYRKKSLECHPDRGGSEAMMKQINAAKAVLLGE
jgi:hypothetical protein